MGDCKVQVHILVLDKRTVSEATADRTTCTHKAARMAREFANLARIDELHRRLVAGSLWTPNLGTPHTQSVRSRLRAAAHQ